MWEWIALAMDNSRTREHGMYECQESEILRHLVGDSAGSATKLHKQAVVFASR